MIEMHVLTHSLNFELYWNVIDCHLIRVCIRQTMAVAPAPNDWQWRRSDRQFTYAVCNTSNPMSSCSAWLAILSPLSISHFVHQFNCILLFLVSLFRDIVFSLGDSLFLVPIVTIVFLLEIISPILFALKVWLRACRWLLFLYLRYPFFSSVHLSAVRFVGWRMNVNTIFRGRNAHTHTRTQQAQASITLLLLSLLLCDCEYHRTTAPTTHWTDYRIFNLYEINI